MKGKAKKASAFSPHAVIIGCFHGICKYRMSLRLFPAFAAAGAAKYVNVWLGLAGSGWEHTSNQVISQLKLLSADGAIPGFWFFHRFMAGVACWAAKNMHDSIRLPGEESRM